MVAMAGHEDNEAANNDLNASRSPQEVEILFVFCSRLNPISRAENRKNSSVKRVPSSPNAPGKNKKRAK